MPISDIGGRSLSPKQKKLLPLLVIIVFKPKYIFLPSKPEFRACQVCPNNPYCAPAWVQLLWDFKFKYSHIYFYFRNNFNKANCFLFFSSSTVQPSESKSINSSFFCYCFSLCWRRNDAALLPAARLLGCGSRSLIRHLKAILFN